MHLRGGPRGYDLARRQDATLSRWARHSQASVPITLVTTDLDITQFQTTSQGYQHACTELERVGRASAILGAHAIRLLARDPVGDAVTLPDLRGRHGLAVVVELHGRVGIRAAAAVLVSAPSLTAKVSYGEPRSASL